VARLYEQGKAVNMASHFEIDDVIDPADSRRWVAAVLRSATGSAGAAPKEAALHRHLEKMPSPSASRWDPGAGSPRRGLPARASAHSFGNTRRKGRTSTRSKTPPRT
jgi:hypothetical protein